jgi:hypothetical protein
MGRRRADGKEKGRTLNQMRRQVRELASAAKQPPHETESPLGQVTKATVQQPRRARARAARELTCFDETHTHRYFRVRRQMRERGTRDPPPDNEQVQLARSEGLEVPRALCVRIGLGQLCGHHSAW